MLRALRDEIDTILRLDPAARTRLEVVLAYPGFHAVVFHRVAHWLWRYRFQTIARWLSNLARFLTLIEIHPAAQIGQRLFIDHGAGVVIGETTEIGDDVTLYQGVTLGGTSPSRGKRHPTLEDGVIVGAGAKIIGGFTIGAGARVGANAVVLHAVAPGETVAGIPARPIGVRPEAPKAFLPYGTPCDDLPDPIARCVASLMDEVANLKQRLAELEQKTEFPKDLPAEPRSARAGRRLLRGVED
ncbi:MAG: serine O-acetyltransferase [Alphaproteobacteria bacterium]|jgi:serine O-acetyltransferase|nr:serine O-acetyltransferase [Alphaproteobacteria bacterium]